MFDQKFGKVQINLNHVIENSGMSKNKIAHKAELERTQLNNYCNNNISRVDLNVLARLCNTLDCKISDILEYIHPEK